MAIEGISVGLADFVQASYQPIIDGLKSFNRSVLGEFSVSGIVVAAKDQGQRIVGGAIGDVHLGWLRVEVLWVDEVLRKQGLGTSILAEMESEGVKRGAKRAMLDTIQFQAPAFYERLGYREYGRIREFTPGSDRIFFEKQLA